VSAAKHKRKTSAPFSVNRPLTAGFLSAISEKATSAYHRQLAIAMTSGQRYAEWRDSMAPIEQHEENPPHVPKKSDGLVRAELREIVESRTFAQGSRLARFLRFVVENHLSGETGQLKETVIATEVYDRPPDYDPKVDSIVRTEARRLRKKLQEYYETEGRYSRVTITIPTGGYIPRIEFRPQPIPTLVMPEPDLANVVENPGSAKQQVEPQLLPSTRWRLLTVVLIAGLVCGIGLWSIARHYRRREEAKLTPGYTANQEAQRLYLEGRFYWAKRTPDFDHKAITRFDDALRLDPNYALAYSGLADAYAITASGLPASERSIEAKSAAEHAVSLDESSAEAHTSLAFVLYKFDWNWEEAELHFRRALQLNPAYALAHHWFGEFLVLRGHPDEGLAQLTQAESLEPISLPIKNDLALGLYRTRHYDQAIAKAGQVLELDPNFSNAYATLVYAYEQKRDYPRAAEADLQVLRLANRPEQEIVALRKTFANSGWRAYWTAELKLLQKAPPGSVPPYVFAEIYLRLGDQETALHFLEKSFEERSDAPLLIGVEPILDPLRSDARFIYLLRRAGLQ
jgi:Tfp pilus assembly protein PilF